MSIGLGITIWLDQTRRDEGEVGPFICFGHIITRGYGCSQVITRGYFFSTIFTPSIITRGYGAKNIITRGYGGPS
jgi:hypothetical protein